MANIIFADYAATQLAGNVAASIAQTSIVVNSVVGFPVPVGGQYFYLTLADAATGGQNKREVVKVTAIVGNVLTVVRAQGGYAAAQFSPGDFAELRLSTQALNDIINIVSGGAPTTSTYVLLSADAALPNRRILTASSRISINDGGPTNPVTLDVIVNSIDNTRLAQMPANTIKGNNTGGLANTADLTVAQVVALLAVVANAGGVVSMAAGTAAARPAFGTVGRVYLATDTGEISRDTGAAWFLLEPALTGDVTSVAGSVATTIAANAVTNAKLAKMAPATIKGNPLGSLNDPLDMTAAQFSALIPTFGPAGGAHARGLVPDPGAVAGLNRYLRDDATFALPSLYTFNVIDYGADPTGAADSTTAINNAYAAIPATGGILYFPTGTYKITATLTTWAKSITVMGDGWNASTIANNSPTLDTVALTGSVRVTNIRFFPSVARSAGIELNISGGAQQVLVDNCFFNACFNPIAIIGTAGQLMITNCSMRLTTAVTGIGIFFNTTGAGITLANILMDAAAISRPRACIMVSASFDIQLMACDLIDGVAALLINPTTGQGVASIYASECFFDNSNMGLSIAPTGSGSVQRCNFVGCWFSSANAQGIHISGGGSTTVNGIDFINAQCYLNGSHGVQVDAGPLNIRFIGGEFGQNTGDGLQFNNTDFCVIGVRSGPTGSVTANTGYGVNVNLSTCDNFTVTGNDLRGNSLGAFNNASTQTNWISGQNLGDTGMFSFRGKTMTADFSSGGATRASLQTSTVNGSTLVLARPNGTATTGAIGAVNNSDLNAALTVFQLRSTAADMQLNVGPLNGGTAFPLSVVMNGPTVSRWTVAGLFLTGPTLPTDDGSSALQVNGNINMQGVASIFKADWGNTQATRAYFQSTVVGNNTILTAVPNGSGTQGIFAVVNNSNLAGPYGAADLRIGTGQVQLTSSAVNAGTVLPIRISPNLVPALECDILSNVNYKKAFADQGYSLQTPLTGFAIVIPDGCSTLALNPAGVLATGTITMPANPIDGQLVSLCTSQTVTALTLNANAGQTIAGAVATLTAAAPASYRYFLGITKWLKVSS